MITVVLLGLLLQTRQTFPVSGKVVSGLTGEPLVRARVMLTPIEKRSEEAWVYSDALGRFEFPPMPAGKYSLQAERLGWARQAFNQRNLHQGHASALVVGPGKTTTNLVFRCLAGAVNSGRVTDQVGDPVVGLLVSGYRSVGRGAQRRLVAAEYAYTDDRGLYRMHSLPAGEYYVFGAGKPSAYQPLITPDGSDAAYPATFFPNTTDPDASKPIPLKAGEEQTADLVVRLERAANLRVVVSTSLLSVGRHAAIGIRGPRKSELPFGSLVVPLSKSTSLSAMPPGAYYLYVLDGMRRRLLRRAIEITSPATEIKLDQSPASVSGTVRFQGDRSLMGPQIAITLLSVDGVAGDTRVVDAEGRFTIPALPSGPYRVMAGAKEQMAILTLAVGDKQFPAGIVEVPETGTIDLTLTLEASSSRVDGQAFRKGIPVAGQLVALVPREGWHNVGLYRFDQTDTDGTFTWKGVAPGDYLMFSFAEGEAVDYMDPEAILKVVETGTPLKVQRGTTQTVRLEATP